MMQRLKSQDNAKNMRRVNYIGDSEEEEELEEDEEQLELRVDGEGGKLFHTEGTMRGKFSKVIINTGSPVSLFTSATYRSLSEKEKW